MYATDTSHPDPDYNIDLYADVAVKRLIAWVVDTIMIALITLLIVPFTAFTAIFFLPLLFVTVSFVYRVIGLSRNSATLGMRLMSIEVRTHRDTWLDTPMAMLHTAGYTISIAMVVPQIISVILMAVSPRGQGLTDMVLGTVVVNRAIRH